MFCAAISWSTLAAKVTILVKGALRVKHVSSHFTESRCPADGVNTEQTTEPTQTTKPTTKPTEPSTEPTTVTTEPTTKPAEPTTEPAEPTTATTEPTTKPTEPTTVTTEPTTNSTETTETTRPTTATTNTMATTKPTTPKPSPTTPAPAPSQHAKETFEVFADDVQCVLMEGEFLFSLVYPKKDNTVSFCWCFKGLLQAKNNQFRCKNTYEFMVVPFNPWAKDNCLQNWVFCKHREKSRTCWWLTFSRSIFFCFKDIFI